ncbi:MAG: prepilin peptidase [Candidatus Pacebacteria bacterium]|nr:prepilin peptidase [Candidatus Paceibacterota bacterium]
MEILLSVFVFIFGAIIGSFLNVVILRHNTGTDLGGRSQCASCGKTLSSLELLPVLSFAIQRGRCRACGSLISWQYPLVEITTATLFFLIFSKGGPILEVFSMFLVSSLLVVILVYDLRHKIIPDRFVFSFIILAFLSLFIDFANYSLVLPTPSDASAGLLLAFPLWLLWHISSGKWIGLGDAKLFLGIGWLLGLEAGITVFVFSFWIGAAVSLFLLALLKFLRKRKLYFRMKPLTIKNEIPFAPFIIVSFFIVYFSHISIGNLLGLL